MSSTKQKWQTLDCQISSISSATNVKLELLREFFSDTLNIPLEKSTKLSNVVQFQKERELTKNLKKITLDFTDRPEGFIFRVNLMSLIDLYCFWL